MLESFERAITAVNAEARRPSRPRTIAVRAHRFYSEGISPGERSPALVSFTQRVAGKTADPEILLLLEKAGIVRSPHASLSRELLKEAFGECIRQLEGRILRGVARPLHVADSAHKIYLEKTSPAEIKPSRLTFRRLVYGQNADPEIVSLMEPHFPRKK